VLPHFTGVAGVTSLPLLQMLRRCRFYRYCRCYIAAAFYRCCKRYIAAAFTGVAGVTLLPLLQVLQVLHRCRIRQVL